MSSLYAMFVSSAFIDVLHLVHTFEPMEPILGCIFGGVLMGASLGVVFQQGATTGGTDLIARLMKLPLPWLPMGKLPAHHRSGGDRGGGSGLRSVYSALYGVVALYIASFVMDQVLYGLDNAKVAYIISDRYEEIITVIIRDMDRGVTILHGQGGLLRGGEEGAAGGLQAAADRGAEAGGEGDRPPPPSSSCARPTRCWGTASAPTRPTDCNGKEGPR